MSKNLIRKGLAFGALVALGSSAVAGAPAYAAGEVTLVPSAGTSYNVLLASDFVLNAGLVSSLPAGNIVQLGYKVVNNTNGDVTAVADTGASGTDQTLTVTAAEGNETTTSTFAPVIGPNTITLSTAADATGSVTVTAFIDADGGEDVDTDEYQITRTINFVKPSEVTATTSFTKPVLGQNTFTATVALSGDINLQQVDSDEVSVEFFKAGQSIADTDDTANSTGTVLTPAQRTNPVAAAWNSTAGTLKAVLYAEADVATPDTNYTAYSVTAGTFSAQAKVAGAVSGAASVQVAAAQTIDNISVAATQSVDAKSTTKGVRDVSANTTTAGAATVRTGKNATVVATFLAADDTVVANETITVTATGSGIAADSVTVNGNAVVDAATSFTATTDAAGQISIAIDGATADATDTVTLAFALQGVTSSDYVVTWNNATYRVFNLANYLDADVNVVAGGSLAVDYLVADQWGQGISGDYRLSVTRSGDAGRTTSANWIYTPVLNNGRATFTIVDNGAGASSTGDTVAIAVEKAVTGGGYTSQAITGNAWDEFVINYVASASTATAVSASATDTTPNITTTAITAADLRYQIVTAPGYADVTHVYGTVTKADGSAIAGAVVTVSGAGLGFQPVAADGSGTASESNEFYTSGSVTVVADSSGRYEVLVYGNIAGKQTVTVTSGAASKTVDLTFNPAAATTGFDWVFTAPATAQSGTTINYSAILVDKFGNPVEAGVGSTTPGNSTVSFSATTIVGAVSAAVVKTDAKGKAAGSATTQVLDSGSLVITATYDADSTDADNALVTATATIVVSDLAKAAADAAAKAAADAAAKAAADAAAKAAADAAAKAAADAAAKAAAIDSMVVSVVTTSQVGRAVDVSVTAKNAAGAAAVGQTVTFTSTGAGSLSALTAVTDANGVATVKLVAGTQDLGTGVVVATANGKSVTGKVDFGQTDASVDIIGKRVYVTTEFAAGKRVTIYDNGVRRYSAIQTSDAEKVVMWNVKAGSHTIVVKISGASSDSVTFLVK